MRAKEIISATIPFGMMFGSFCMLLIVGINGVPGRFMGPIFDIDNTGLSIFINGSTGSTVSDTNSNTTGVDLRLPDKYSFYLWNYATTTDGKTTFHDKGWDYAKDFKLNVSQAAGSNSSALLRQYEATLKSARDKIPYTQGFFLPAIISNFLVVALGIASAIAMGYGYPVPLIVASAVTGIAFIISLVFAVLITVLIFTTKSKLNSLVDAGAKFTMGNSDLGVVWLAVVHILAVGVMWLLMGLGVMKYNVLLKPREKSGGSIGERLFSREEMHNMEGENRR
ncbi:hypothetical protein BJY01DRAFT_244797 [Aspergillus pseudoustus]|uniref:SUR7/PalI family-domain-containing protein n=1 Tax=Aspergillus pseudoustus TaxID=1810923 RepID=A0ABR4KKW3_9EURO